MFFQKKQGTMNNWNKNSNINDVCNSVFRCDEEGLSGQAWAMGVKEEDSRKEDGWMDGCCRK